MPVWFPQLDKLETYIPEPFWFQDDGSLGSAEGSLLDPLEMDDSDNHYFETNQDDTMNMAFLGNDDEDGFLGDEDMFYFDTMRDMDVEDLEK
jgi:hypothetical protein